MVCRQCPHCAPRFIGDAILDKDGYLTLPDPRDPRGRRIAKHRLVMELHLGRRLDKREQVHHQNGKPLDNRIENLVVMSHAEHRRAHRKKVKWKGRKIELQEAFRRIGITGVGFRLMKRKRGWSHQQTVNYYIEKRSL